MVSILFVSRVHKANPGNRHGCRDSLFLPAYFAGGRLTAFCSQSEGNCRRYSALAVSLHLTFAGMVRSFISCCRATGYAQGGGKCREDADGNLKDGFPGFFLHGVRWLRLMFFWS